MRQINVLSKCWQIALVLSTLSLLFSCDKQSEEYFERGVEYKERGTKYAVWGVTANGKVWKWDENSKTWFEPNAAARLAQISVGAASIMGLSNDGRIFKWNGNAWYEPNPNARLTKISVIDDNDAWGIGNNGKVFNTCNGGISWSQVILPQAFPQKIKELSARHQFNVWAVADDNRILHFDGFNWDEPNKAARLLQISAMENSTQSAWGIGANGRIFKWNITKTNWDEPNLSASLVQIAGFDHSNAWGIGNDGGRVFSTKNGGSSWNEPNPAARLKQISVGYE